jgi:hypothetical protein
MKKTSNPTLLQLDNKDQDLPLGIFLIILGKALYDHEGDIEIMGEDILVHLHNLLIEELEERQGTLH